MWKAWIELIRPSNVITAFSDVMAGIALACLFTGHSMIPGSSLCLLGLSSMLLYTGGIVFNDVFDAKLDKKERPERPIPSGRITKTAASTLGLLAFLLAFALSFKLSSAALYCSLGIAALCLLYNSIAKHHFLFGPIVMGSCRGANLLLGMSVLPEALSESLICLVPLVYIASVTNISRGEVYGNNRAALLVSMVLYILVISVPVYFSLHYDNYLALLLIIAFGTMIITPLVGAYLIPIPAKIRKAVKSGVLALILLNSCWVAVSGFWGLAIITLCTLPLSLFVAKKFAVT